LTIVAPVRVKVSLLQGEGRGREALKAVKDGIKEREREREREREKASAIFVHLLLVSR